LRNKVWRNTGKQRKKIDIILTWLINIAIIICVILLIALLFKEKPEAIEETSPPPVTPLTAETVTTPVTTTTITTVMTAEATAVTTANAIETLTEDPADTETSVTANDFVPAPDYDKEYFNNFLFIGDSISTGFYGYDYLNAANVFAKIGFTPLNVRTSDNNGVTVYQKLAALKPENVVIMLGTNGLSYLDADEMIKDYSILIDEIRDILPDVNIVILTIPPVTREHEADMPENLALVTAYNEKLFALSQEKETEFIDIYALLADEDGYTRPEYAEADGLHIKGPAYKAILYAIEKATDSTAEAEE
jgi:lysophospholipase L1-like esterase